MIREYFVFWRKLQEANEYYNVFVYLLFMCFMKSQKPYSVSLKYTRWEQDYILNSDDSQIKLQGEPGKMQTFIETSILSMCM